MLGRRDQHHATRPDPARRAAQEVDRIRHVLDHVVDVDDVERGVGEGEALVAAVVRVVAPLARERHRARREIAAERLGVGVDVLPVRQARAVGAADIEDARRAKLAEARALRDPAHAPGVARDVDLR